MLGQQNIKYSCNLLAHKADHEGNFKRFPEGKRLITE
jgi:hypothetical protein